MNTAQPISSSPRALVLATAHSYRLNAFQAAAERLGVALVRGLDAPPAHVKVQGESLRLDFRDPDRSLRNVRAYARQHPLQAVIPADDSAVVLAARIGAALGLRHNAPVAAEAARDKRQMRALLAAAGLSTPWYQVYSRTGSPESAAAGAAYPCVLKPTCLSGSRGVIRANNRAEFVTAFGRIARLMAPLGADEILVEGYIPGREFALEGVLSGGALTVLALFDKPDPLDGPYFEETIYVTPSREPDAVQAAIAGCAADAARAVGLSEGAVHAEVRFNDAGPWLIEIAGRSIGGLCGQTLRFAQQGRVTLEEIILRQALGLEFAALEREQQAGGVIMLPIPTAGILLGWDGQAAALAVPGIESLEITARLNYPLTPLPEGDSYLGFIFARAATPAAVEAALRASAAELHFHVEPQLVVAAS